MDLHESSVTSFGTAALLRDIERHPGFAGLKPRYRETLLQFARLADPDTHVVSGSSLEIAQRLGFTSHQGLYNHVAVWHERGLVGKSRTSYEVDPETKRATFRSGSSWQVLPEFGNTAHAHAHAEAPPRTEAPPEAPPRVLAYEGSFLGPEQGKARQGLRHEGPVSEQQLGRANDLIDMLEGKYGEPIIGRSRDALFAALVEDEAGVHACYEEAKARGRDPLRLFLRMVNDGDWRKKGSPDEASSIDDLIL